MAEAATLLEEATALLRRAVDGVEPDMLEPDDAFGLVRAFVAAEKLCAAGRTVVAPYIGRSRLWARAGYKSPADWLAKEAGLTYAEARAAIETGTRLLRAPEVDEAVRNGELSAAQAKEVAAGAEADPSSAGHLLEVAKQKTLGQLREESRRIRAAAQADQMGAYEAQHRARACRHGRNEQGMTWLYAQFTPELGSAVVNTLEAETNRVFGEAYKRGEREDRSAYMADALARLLSGAARAGGRGARAEVVVMVDRDALLRGRVGPGERCEVLGFGPIPVPVCRRIMEDAFLKGVLVEGTEVRRVRHFKRHIHAEVRTALCTDAYLADGDLTCSVDGCDRRDIEWDHNHDYAKRGPTSVENLNPLCHFHHDEKTAGRLALVNGRWVVVEAGQVCRAPP